MGKIYKTANGKEIDMERLVAKNETVRAVGNMNVNARGDVIDNSNETTSARSTQVNKSYRKQTGNVAKDMPIVSSKKAAEKLAIEEPIIGLDDIPEPEPVVEEVKPKAKTKTKAKAKAKPEPTEEEGGLAAAIAKAKASEK